MTVFDVMSFYIDQHISLLRVTVTTVLVAIAVMFLICLLFIPNIPSVLSATAALFSINIGVFGLLSWWEVDLDPVSMITIVMAIGFSVDFTCHISYHFYKAEGITPEARLTEALKEIGWPMIQAGASTISGVLILGGLSAYIATTFFKTTFLVVFLGMVHGLVVLPVVLTSIPALFHNTCNEQVTFCKSASSLSVNDHGQSSNSTSSTSRTNGTLVREIAGSSNRITSTKIPPPLTTTTGYSPAISDNSPPMSDLLPSLTENNVHIHKRQLSKRLSMPMNGTSKWDSVLQKSWRNYDGFGRINEKCCEGLSMGHDSLVATKSL